MSEHLIITQSRTGAAASCLRKHYYSYVEGYRPFEDPEPIWFGTLLHTGLEFYFRSPDDRLAEGMQAMRRVPKIDPYALAKAEEMLIAYDAMWHDAPWEIISVEESFMYELRPGVFAAGKFDVIIRNVETGELAIVDHKTSSEDISPTSFYWKRLRLNRQISLYFDGARSKGYDVTTFIFDVLRKPGLKPSLATPPDKRKYTKAGKLDGRQRAEDETVAEFGFRVREALTASPADYFRRESEVRLEADLERARRDWNAWADILLRARTAQTSPRNTDSCFDYGKPCPYFGVCAGEDTLDSATFKKLDNIFPELELPAYAKPI